MGKGSGRRPSQITREEEEARWNMAFGKKKYKCERCGKTFSDETLIHTCSPQKEKHDTK